MAISDEHQRVPSPLRGWVGGKHLLARRIIERIPEHTCYAEAFAGSAAALFTKQLSEVEVINDANGEVVNLYRVLQHHLEEFCRQFRWALASRKLFEWLDMMQPETLTDIQRAARYYYLQRMSFGGRIKGKRTFGTSTTQKPKVNLLRIEEELSEAHLRLSRVAVEHLSCWDFIPRYDRPHTFFYLDPPYWGCEDYYGPGLFQREDFERLRKVLTGIQGKFLLSLNDVPEVRELFGCFTIEPVTTRYTCMRAGNQKAAEVLIRNY